jgi:cation diffusion facilitator family transporter
MATTLYWALLGNFIIAVSKFISGYITGSATMISEGYHSLSDTINQLLLLFGIKRSERKPDQKHNFGYSQVQFFWSLIVAILIFGFAGGLAFIHGYEKLFEPYHSIENQSYLVVYIILIVSFIIEGSVLIKAYKEVKVLQKEKEFDSFIHTIEDLGNPALLTVLIEDALALFGIIIAFIATLLTDLTHNVIYDGLGSTAIGILLMVGALFLARENKSYLIGRSIRIKDKEKIIFAIKENKFVKNVGDFRSMLLGPDDMILSIEVDFLDDLDTEDLEIAIDELENKIIKFYPKLTKRKIFIEPN